jgi:hypothetical protein
MGFKKARARKTPRPYSKGIPFLHHHDVAAPHKSNGIDGAEPCAANTTAAMRMSTDVVCFTPTVRPARYNPNP